MKRVKHTQGVEPVGTIRQLPGFAGVIGQQYILNLTQNLIEEQISH
jgi:hypothetical protein